MMIKLKQDVIEKTVVLEEADRFMLANFLKFLKFVVDLLEEDDFYIDSLEREGLHSGDLEIFVNIIEEILNENKIVLTKD